MKIGAYRPKKLPHHTPSLFISLSKQDREKMGSPASVDVLLVGDKLIIQPGSRIKLSFSGAGGCIRLTKDIQNVLASYLIPARARLINYTTLDKKLIIDAFEIMQIVEAWTNRPKEREVEPLYNVKENKSGECKHFKNPMSPKTIYRIAGEVDIYFSDGRYLKNYSDKQIAKELDVSEFSVAKIREEVFGPILADPKQEKMDEISQQLATLQKELAKLQE